MNKKKKLRSDIMLLTTALIWGSSFVAQRTGMAYIEPFTFNAARCILACIAVFIVAIATGSFKRQRTSPNSTPMSKKTLFLGGTLCGVVLFFASSLQQFGIVTTSAGKAGFITALYIVLVPILGITIGKKVKPILWLCVVLAIVGLYLLTVKEGFSIQSGDILILICALFFAIHILVIDYFSPKTDGVLMSLIQFAIGAILSLIASFLFDSPDMASLLKCWLPIVYAGVMSSGVAYTLQIVAQKDADPTVASLLLSMESVFSVLSGWIILGEQLSAKELTGCAIMFFAVVLSQLPSKKELMKGRTE